MSTNEELLHDTAAASPPLLLEEWRRFVDDCELGYEYNVMEYHADLSVRDRIEACLRMAGRTDADYAGRVAQVDDRFRALLQPGLEVGPDGDPWWHRGVLRYAGYALADGLREWFSVEVEARG